MIFCCNRILSDSELSRLKDYNFKPGNFTFLDRVMMKYLWEPVVRALPTWFSPNLLTLLGGLCVFIMNFFVFYYVPNFKAVSVPKWTSLVSSILVFVYTTFDGIDGMQARRLKLESPMGQLLDHGTDGLVSSFFCYFTFLVSPSGFSMVNTLITVSALINSSAVNWREENFGTFSYTNSFFIFGVSEPLLAVVSILFIDYFYPKFWLSPMVKILRKYKSLRFIVKYLPKNLTWFTGFLYFALAISFYTFVGFPYEMYKSNKSKKNLIRLTLYLIFNCVFPPMLTLSLPQKLHGLYSIFVSSIGGMGVIFIIIANLRRKKHVLFYPEFLFHYVLVFIGYALVLSRVIFGLKYDKIVFNSVCFERTLLFLTVFGIFLGLLKAVRVFHEIKTHLGLPFFTTKRPSKRL
ncbi:ethanolamine phosphotransferase [Theileria orientalis]|uniref:Ethanolamine phosphotransferase n=1 Tax=Theileria orientalis TaxID=68886 RepID=A0A976M4Y7_THEOR|nr:ethanolamine phosphotransferase [Theileria orientalis]